MMRLFKILMVMLVCAEAWAWTEEAWSAKATSPRKAVGDAKFTARDYWYKDCYSAMVERASIAWSVPEKETNPDRFPYAWGGTFWLLDAPPAPTWSRLEHFNLSAMKEWVKMNCVYFVDESQMGTNENFNQWFKDNVVIEYAGGPWGWVTNYPDYVPRYTPESLCAHSGIPPNFFDVTFWRDIGGYADLPDGSIMPGYSRADYGPDGLRKAISNLTCVYVQSPSITAKGEINKRGGWGEVIAEEMATNGLTCLKNLALAKSRALSDIAVFTNVSEIYYYSAIGDPVWAGWSASYGYFDIKYLRTNANGYLVKTLKFYTESYPHKGFYGTPAPRSLYEDIPVGSVTTSAISSAYGWSAFIEWPDGGCDEYDWIEFALLEYTFLAPVVYAKYSGFVYP